MTRYLKNVAVHVSYACVRADSSGDSNSVQMGGIVTECSAVTKRVVAKNGSGTEIVSSNKRYKGESEGDSFIISNGVDVDDEYVNMNLRNSVCVWKYWGRGGYKSKAM